MDSLVVRVVADAVRGDAPNTPSAPVEIGTGVRHHGHTETASWQTLILMFVAVLVIGTVVLLCVVRQRRKLLERRRLRQSADAARYAGAQSEPVATPRPGAVDPRPDATAAAVLRAEPTGHERVT